MCSQGNLRECVCTRKEWVSTEAQLAHRPGRAHRGTSMLRTWHVNIMSVHTNSRDHRLQVQSSYSEHKLSCVCVCAHMHRHRLFFKKAKRNTKSLLTVGGLVEEGNRWLVTRDT